MRNQRETAAATPALREPTATPGPAVFVRGVLPPAAEMHRAVRSKDGRYDGIFYLGVRTTGIFCRPSCRARRPLPRNIEFFPSVKEALFAGYRACKRCRPLERPGAEPEWARRLIARVDEDPETRIRDADLRAMNLDPVRVRRYFRRTYGMTYQAFARARRLGTALDRLRRGETLDDVIFGHGYESHSGFREAFAQVVGRPPGKARGLEIIRLERIETPLGSMFAGAVDDGVCFLEFADRRGFEGQLAALRSRRAGAIMPGTHAHLRRLRAELEEYFAGRRRRFSVPLVDPGTPFQRKVWDELRSIPYGETRSYQEIARAIGVPRAVRAVGRANGQNPIAILQPCHRVVNKDGRLGGYGGGLRRKEFLLRLERGVREAGR